DSTVPFLPLSRPVSTMTWSPLRILFISMFLISWRSEHFRRERDDLHEALGAQLAGDRPEDAGADRLELGVQQHGGVAVELDERAVRATNALGGAHDDGRIDLALLHAPTRRGFLDAHLDHVTDRGVAALRAAQHLDAHDGLGARVVGDVEPRLHLNHVVLFPNLVANSDFWTKSEGRSVLGPARGLVVTRGRGREPGR